MTIALKSRSLTFRIYVSGLLVLCVLGVLWFDARDRLMTVGQFRYAAWVALENKLKERYGILPELCDFVSSGIPEEKRAPLDEMLALSKEWQAVADSSERIRIATKLEHAIPRLYALADECGMVAENNQADLVRKRLNELQAAASDDRLRYNEAVRAYNNLLKKWAIRPVARLEGHGAISVRFDFSGPIPVSSSVSEHVRQASTGSEAR